MPSNVTIDFEKARCKLEQANTPEAKLEALIEMQRFAPAHKGGEHLRADISKKMAGIRKEIENAPFISLFNIFILRMPT